MKSTFGIEEEFMLLDPRTLTPVDLAGDAIADLQAVPHRGEIKAEFLSSQVEYASAVCTSLDDAMNEIQAVRTLLHAWAQQRSLIVAGSGTPYRLPLRPPTFASDRYKLIARDVGMLAREHLLNGMHVHVGVSSAEEGVHVANGLRAWLPLLLSLSSNSPFWAGQDTGHHSWRSIQTRRWTTYGVPPYFHDYDEYASLIERLLGVGVTSAYSSNGWAVRLSGRFPTVEIRICDTQLDTASALAMTSLIRALAHVCARNPHPPRKIRTHLLDSELWHAARYGTGNGVYDPMSDSHTTAAEAIRSLRRVIQPIAEEHGAEDCITDFLERVTADGTGASRQRHALNGGTEQLAKLYERTFSSGTGNGYAALDAIG